MCRDTWFGDAATAKCTVSLPPEILSGLTSIPYGADIATAIGGLILGRAWVRAADLSLCSHCITAFEERAVDKYETLYHVNSRDTTSKHVDAELIVPAVVESDCSVVVLGVRVTCVDLGSHCRSLREDWLCTCRLNDVCAVSRTVLNTEPHEHDLFVNFKCKLRLWLPLDASGHLICDHGNCAGY